MSPLKNHYCCLLVCLAALVEPALGASVGGPHQRSERVPVVRESERVRVYSTGDVRTTDFRTAEESNENESDKIDKNNGYSASSVANHGTDTNTNRPTEKRAAKAPGDSDSLVWEILQQLESLQNELANLNGRLDVQTKLLSNLTTEYQQGYEDLDRRIMVMEKHLTGAESSVGQSSVGLLRSDGSKALPVQAKQTSTNLTPKKNELKNTIKNGHVVNFNPDGYVREKSDYQKAHTLLKAKKVKEASAAFQAFVTSYPSSSLAPNALYWVGELFLAEQPPKYRQAQETFEQFLVFHGKHNKVPSVMYKLALIDIKGGRERQAERRLEQLLEAYPDSSPAKLADSQLERLRRSQ